MSPRSKTLQAVPTTAFPNPDTSLPLVGPRNANVFLRVVHTADNHLRMSQDSYVARGRDFYLAAASVIDIARDYGADMILNAGDFLNVPECQSLTVQQMMQLDVKLREIGKPMFVVQGNHDSTTPSWSATLSGSAHGTQPGLRDGNGLIPGTGILCLPFLTPTDLKHRIETMTPQEKREAKVLVWHGPVLEFAKFPTEGILTIADFMTHPWEAVLLGDIHIRKYVRHARPDGGTCIIGYPGATELCAANEPLDHSCTVIDFDASYRVVSMSHVPVAHRKVLPLRINNTDDLGAAVATVEEVVKTTDRLMVLVKYSDALSGVRNRLQLAAGKSDTIIRAEAFMTQFETAPDLVASAAATMPKPMDFLERVAPEASSDLKTLIMQLENFDSTVSPAEQLNVYCQNRLPV